MVPSSSNGLLPSCKTLQNLTYLFHEKSEIVILRPILFPFAQILGKNVILTKSNIQTVSGSATPSKKSEKSNEHILKKKRNNNKRVILAVTLVVHFASTSMKGKVFLKNLVEPLFSIYYPNLLLPGVHCKVIHT